MDVRYEKTTLQLNKLQFQFITFLFSLFINIYGCVLFVKRKCSISTRWEKLCATISGSSAPIHRITFLLAHYQMWIQRAAQNKLDTENEITCIQELVNLLKGYSRSSIIDDFHSIKDMIEGEDEENELKLNANNSNNNSNQKQRQKIYEHFQLKLGKCKNYSNCKSFMRNRRSRTTDNVVKERRAAFYIREEDVQKYGTNQLSRFEVREVILQSRLDVIHNYIFHSDDEVMHVNESNSSKFVTKVGVDDDDDSKNNNNNNKSKVKKMGQYSFGCWTDYWDTEHHSYVHAKYPNLKTELMSNAFHRLSIFSYEELEERARDILKTRYGQKLRSLREHSWMKIKGKQLLKKGSLITEKHLISLLAYTNFDTLQFEFKKNGFRRLNDRESDSDIRKRNSEIANWSQAIYEVVYCWGSIMSKKRPLYHGINCKILFGQFSTWFELPTSLTTNVRVAQNFAKDGIILVLKHAEQADTDSLMFDVSPISDYPNEEERIIFRSLVQFSDILMDNSSLKQWMAPLKYFERIRNGRFLSHISCSDEQQRKIVFMIQNFLDDRKNSSSNAKNDEFYENGNVPIYVQQLFKECAKFRNTFNLNAYAVNRAITNQTLLRFLDGSKTGKKSELMNIFKTVRDCNVYEWRVTGDSFASYFSDAHPWVNNPEMCRINLSKETAEPKYLQFHWQLQNYRANDTLQCALQCDHIPTNAREIMLILGIFIEETRTEAYSFAIVTHQKMYALQLHTIVESKKILESNPYMKIKEFNIKLSVFLCNK